MTKSPKKKVEERVYFDTKYGPLTIFQKGAPVKEISAQPVPENKKENGGTHMLESMRISLHLERFQGIDPFLEEIKCTISIPEIGYKLTHESPCQMRIGITHGAAVVSTETLFLDFENTNDKVMELEFYLGETQVIKQGVPIKVLG